MKPIKVYQANEQMVLELDKDFSGKALVKVFNHPELINGLRQQEVLFSEGIGRLPLENERCRFFLSVQLDGETYVGAYRRIPIEGLYNLRDLGGYLTKDGKMTKWGLIYRSDALDHLSEMDREYLEEMDVSSVIDFRSSQEIGHQPDFYIGEQHHYHFDPHAEAAREASAVPSEKKGSNKDQEKVARLEKMAQSKAGQEQLIQMQEQMVEQMHQLVVSDHAKKAYQDFLQVLIRQEVPMIFHCQGGKDRTGWAAAIVLGLLGVEKEVIYQDYLLTNIYNTPRNQKRMEIYQQYTKDPFVLDYLASLQKTLEKYLDSAFEAMEEHYGSMEQYAKQALGMTDEDIKKLQELYLY